jgi:hypothetical protein
MGAEIPSKEAMAGRIQIDWQKLRIFPVIAKNSPYGKIRKEWRSGNANSISGYMPGRM